MTEMTPYSSVISLRSRRLRTVGIALMVVVLALFFYGVFGLMPAMKSAAALHTAAIQKAEAQKAIHPGESMKTIRRIHRLMGIKLLFTDAYWLTCGLFAFAAMVVAWLDFREVARRFQTARRSLWDEASKKASAGERLGELSEP